MEQITTSIEIAATITAVFDQLTDVAANKLWMASVRETVMLGNGPMAVASRFVESGGFLGVTVTDEKVVTQFERPVKFGFQGQFIANAAEYELIQFSPQSTMVKVTLTAEPPRGLPAIVRKQIMRRTRQRMDADLLRLKRLIEEGA